MPDDTFTITLTTGTVAAMVAEVRDQLDRWLAQFPKPGKTLTYELNLVRVRLPHLTYRLERRQFTTNEIKSNRRNK